MGLVARERWDFPGCQLSRSALVPGPALRLRCGSEPQGKAPKATARGKGDAHGVRGAEREVLQSAKLTRKGRKRPTDA